MPFTKSRSDINLLLLLLMVFCIMKQASVRRLFWPWFIYERKTAVSFILSFDCGYV